MAGLLAVLHHANSLAVGNSRRCTGGVVDQVEPMKGNPETTTDLGWPDPPGRIALAFRETLRRYPHTAEGALVFFAAAAGLLDGELTDEDISWGMKVREEYIIKCHSTGHSP